MKIGSCHLWGEDLDAFRSEIQLANTLDFDYIGIGDSPAGWHDIYLSMAVAAQETTRATLLTWVTSPKVRHPLAAANALSSLYDLSGGRIACGLSTGGSNTMSCGYTPATQKEIRDYLQAFQALFKGESTSYQGRPVAALKYARNIPLYYSAFGPKALQLAGEQADGVIVFSNDKFEGLDERLALVRSSAKKAGRNPDDLKIFVTAFCSIRPTREQAIDDLLAFIVVNGLAIMRNAEAMANVPTALRSAFEELGRRYDPSEHVVVGGNNAMLLEELGLKEYLAQFDTVVGTPEHVGGVLEQLEQRGVSGFIANMPGHADKEGTMRRLAEIVK
jgi:alkanesulfonate monooxygenase SsuD/methylene tetrahydromethanopterin reductase-like flavin-dependent oxidoreductase (luciferase family)